ncbi:MAG: hypothetical protein R3E32_08680 [Chitinophagales bacterium]
MKHNYKYLQFIILFLLAATFSLQLQAQDLYLFEDFNECELPSDWRTKVAGEAAVWGVGISENENAAENNSMDGTCMVYFDDDAAGENTPAWSLELESPTFDATVNAQITLEVDVHFRNWNGSASLVIEAFNGSEYIEVERFQGEEDSGWGFPDYRHVFVDLTPHKNDKMTVRFVYDDGNDWTWWASIDNFEVKGWGKDGDLLLENFNACEMPEGWETNVEKGSWDWQFGTQFDSDEPIRSIDGSCFVFFDDDAIGDTIPSKVQLISPSFNGRDFAQIFLEMDVHHRDYQLESFNVYVFDGSEYHRAKSYTGENIAGEFFNSAIHDRIDISAYRAENMHLIFEYDDNNMWGWWSGFDNVRVYGEGESFDICDKAKSVTLGGMCVEGTNINALFEGSASECVESLHGIWYSFVAPTSGAVTIRAKTDFNDVLTVFSGTCGNLQQINCTNYDEFGFVGEILPVMDLTPNQTYFVRVSGAVDKFGKTEGNVCLSIAEGAATKTPPANDLCSDAIVLTINSDCTLGTNKDATFFGPEPSLNLKSKSSIWYSFEAPEDGEVIIESNADFADVLTVFSGTCGNLTEIRSSDFGHSLHLTDLEVGSTYLIQSAGFFSTVEGTVCMKVSSAEAAPENDLCNGAINLQLGESCTIGNNTYATFNGPRPSCDVAPTASIWFRFTAPSSGRVLVNTGADFVNVLSVFGGPCSNLEEMGCAYNPSKCDEGVVFELEGDADYFLQVASAQNPFGYTYGDVCVRVSDYENAPVKARLKVFLEGAYSSSNQMNNHLKAANLIPFDQPYNRAPWNYNGTECITEMPVNAVDWVLVELRDANNSETIVERKAAILLSNGNIVDEGNDGVLFQNATENNSYYTIVRHRNHLAIMSSVPIPFPNSNHYHFTADPSYVMGGAAQLTQLENGSYAAIAGDFNADGVISVFDFNYYSEQKSMLNAYVDGDCNLDRAVGVQDYNLYQGHPSVIGVEEVRY